MLLLIIFIAVPLIEIGLFIQIGGILGLWPTLFIVVATAFAGTVLLRSQGFATMARLQDSIKNGENPANPMAHGALILVAGVVLLTPGFFTDGIGLLLLLPPVRAAVIRWGTGKFQNATVVMQSEKTVQSNLPDIVDAEFSVVDDENSKNGGTSGWTKH